MGFKNYPIFSSTGNYVGAKHQAKTQAQPAQVFDFFEVLINPTHLVRHV